MMHRPTVIIVEPQPQDSISTRKLVLETAKFNVLTCYSASDFKKTFELFGNADAVVLHTQTPQLDPRKALQHVRASAPKKPIIVLTPNATRVAGADHILSSYEPEKLLELLRETFGDPRKVKI